MKPINLSEKRKLVKINEILKEIEDDDLYTKFIKKLDVTFVAKIKELMSVILITKNKNAIVSINIPVNVDELEEDTPTYFETVEQVEAFMKVYDKEIKKIMGVI